MTLDDIAIFIILVLCIQAFLMQFGEYEGWLFDQKNIKRAEKRWGDKSDNKRKAGMDEKRSSKA